MKQPIALIRRFLSVALLGGALTLTAFAAVRAEPAPRVFTPVPVPADWMKTRVGGINLALPPDLQVLKDQSYSHVWGHSDKATRTGYGIGLGFEDKPERQMQREGATEVGQVVLPGGQVFRLYTAVAPEKAGVPGRIDMLVSDLPMRGKDHLILSLIVMNVDIDAYRGLFDGFVSSLQLPPPGMHLQRDYLRGIVRLPLGPGWAGGEDTDADAEQFRMKDQHGYIRISRGEVFGAATPKNIPGQPVLFLGQKAQLFAFENDSETVDDGTGDKGQTRGIVLENCLPGNEAITFYLSGMPGLFRDPRVAQMFDGAEIVLPEGSVPCPASVMPALSDLQSGAPRPVVVPPFDVALPSPIQSRDSGEALGKLFSYDLPLAWSATRYPGDQSILFAKKDGSASILLARAEALMSQHGPAVQVPQGVPHKSDILFGWPTERFQWTPQDTPGVLKRFFVYAHCISGYERFGALITGTKDFHDNGELSTMSRYIQVTMPKDIRPCPDPTKGIGVTPAAQSAAQPDAQPLPKPEGSQSSPPTPAPVQSTADPEPKPQQDPVETEQTPAIVDDGWYGQPPVATWASPATESLAGRGTKPAQVTPAGAEPSTGQPATGTPQPAVPPPPPFTPSPVQQDRDKFLPLQGGYSTYQNDRYGTYISYPSSYFLPDPAPASGDGRRFMAIDGSASFHVFAQYNAEMLNQRQQIARDKSSGQYDRVTYERAGPGWYVLSGHTGSDIFYRRVTEDRSGLIRVFEITYPQALKTEFDALVTFMVQSFGPPSDR